MEVLDKMKNILNSRFTLTILAKMHQGFRASQIAEQLGVTPQNIHHYTERMIDAGLIAKDTSNGIKWILKEKGKFILKQRFTGSVNSFTIYQTKPVARLIPTRIDNLSFAFRVFNYIPEDSNLHWNQIKNDISKSSIKHDTHTVELIRSERNSSMLIHLHEKYCFDWTREYINQYNLAIHYAKQAATKFNLHISDHGYPVKRPHIAFEQDIVASFLAASYTAETNTNSDYNAWIDSSNGGGEIETNDYGYAYDYLLMPKTVREIAVTIATIRKQTSGYERHYHPQLTVNN